MQEIYLVGGFSHSVTSVRKSRLSFYDMAVTILKNLFSLILGSCYRHINMFDVSIKTHISI